uniref:Uncharacterized protein n=1 Tax=Tanacetum cinerariifolium TaxID=118510 RepID=A0A699IBD7_TANCI|nr:hypothetical protein [Tanacetum cinerariifolium]
MENQEQNPPQQEQPFVAAKQVGFNLEDIILNTNNEVTLLYPEHNNKDYFKCVSDFISKCFLRKPFTRSPNMYKEYLAKFWYSAKALENSKVSFSIPTGGVFGEAGVNTFRNAIGAHYLPHSSEYVAPPFVDVVSSAMDSNPSQPSVSTHVDTGMPKQDQQATGDLTSLGVTSEARANPQINSGTDPHVLVDKTKYVSEGLETVLTQPITRKGPKSIARQVKEEEASSAIKLEDIVNAVSHVQPSFEDLDSPEDDIVIVVDDSDEDKEDEIHPTPNAETKDTSVHKSSSPSSLPTELKDLLSKFNDLTEEAKPKTLNDLPSLPNKVINALNQFAQAITSKKTRGDSVPSAAQVRTQPAEGKKNTNQAIIS